MTEFSAPLTKRSVDPFLIALGLLLMIVSGYSIWSTSYKLQTSILASGKIVTCHGGCKYKSPDDYFWLGAYNNLPVMDKSMVFTPSQSTATIILNSGTKLTLYPNSLVRITSNKKGSTIDIIEGKINFDKIIQSTNDKIMLKGKEMEMPTSNEKAVAEISAEPELLEIKAPEMVFLRGSSILVPVEIQKGKGPFRAHLEGVEKEEESASHRTEFSHPVHKPGIYTLKVTGDSGVFATKLLNVIDLRLPELIVPKSGDHLYSKSFRPQGEFDPEQTEFSLTRENNTVFKGLMKSLPTDLPPGNYQISARKASGNVFGDWSSPVSFYLVTSKIPQIDISNGAVFFEKVRLRWKKIMPVPHILTIRNIITKEELKVTLVEESFDYVPKLSGKFSWSVGPLLIDGFNEKVESLAFTFIDLSTFLIEPSDRKQFLTSDLKESIEFKWLPIEDANLSLSLELKNEKRKSYYTVTGEDSFLVELPNVKDYKWRLVFKTIDGEFSTPERSFQIEPPPPAAPIREDEIIFKE